MVRGRISYEGKTELTIVQGRLNAARYCADNILAANNINALEWPPNYQNLPHVGPHWPLIARTDAVNNVHDIELALNGPTHPYASSDDS